MRHPHCRTLGAQFEVLCSLRLSTRSSVLATGRRAEHWQLRSSSETRRAEYDVLALSAKAVTNTQYGCQRRPCAPSVARAPRARPWWS